MEDVMKVYCPKCTREYEVTPDYIDEAVECEACNYSFTVENPHKTFQLILEYLKQPIAAWRQYHS